jgi:hypothetical protein
VDCRDDSGRTLLSRAWAKGRIEVAMMLAGLDA